MNNMKSNTPNGYYSEVINTHCDGSMIQKISIWKNARKLLKRKNKKKGHRYSAYSCYAFYKLVEKGRFEKNL